MTYKYGIDFGTTNSSIAMRFVGDDKAEHTLVVEVKNTRPRETMPSVILIDDKGGVFAGSEALEKYSQGLAYPGERKLIRRIKLDLEKYKDELTYTVGEKTYCGEDLIAELLRALRAKAKRLAMDLDLRMSGVVMGVPVHFGEEEKIVLKKALVKAGFYNSFADADAKTEFVSEPVAVAVEYGLDMDKDETVLVFDFGGGTLDIAIVDLKKQVNPDRLHPHETIAKKRITLGGEELTRLFFINSFCKRAKYGTQRIANEFGFSPALTPDELWDKLSSCEDGIYFIDEIEQCKCALSSEPYYKFSYMGRYAQLEEKTFMREDFSIAIRDKLREIKDLVLSSVEESEIIEPYAVDKVVLAGGSSLIPAVQDCLVSIFGAKRIKDKPGDRDKYLEELRYGGKENAVLTSIVRGLALIGCRDESLIDDVADNDYGVWDDDDDTFIPIIKKGTPVKATALDKISGRGLYQDVVCNMPSASTVAVKVYQRSEEGERQLTTIVIQDPGSKQYNVNMHIDKKRNIHLVDF